MNLKINKTQANFILDNFKLKQYLIGSHLYGSQKENSDVDYLIIYKSFHEQADVIKAFIGFAKRDMKFINKGKNKLFHINRGLYCAECLLDNRLPILSEFNFKELSIEALAKKEAALRATVNGLLEKNELTLFPKMPML